MPLSIRFFVTIIVALSGGVLWASGTGAFAHPHVFIEARVKLEFDDQGLAGIRMVCTFDDMFAVMVAGDFDKNNNGILEPEEMANVKKGMFDNLVHYSYYAFIKIDSKPFEVKYVRDFKATLNKGVLTYEFLISCHVTATAQPKVVALTSYDPDYYCALFFAEDTPLMVVGDGNVQVTTAIKKDMETTYYFDMLNPWQQRVSFRIKQ